MKKSIPLFLYGSIIIFEGIYLFFAMPSNFQSLQFTLGIGLVIGAIFAFLTALTRQKRQVQFAYHEMHALSMLVYGASIMVFCNSLDMLLHFTAFLFLFYAFSEIIFCIWLFNLREKVVYKIVIVRILLGALTGIGTVIAMKYTGDKVNAALPSFGVLFVLIGLNVLLYVPVMRSKEME
ncbi:MAG: hypothetical protein IPI46_02780 [Bacteroidetes bacterium]|nr:hypothetical protein [Bacteroidota bacterium]